MRQVEGPWRVPCQKASSKGPRQRRGNYWEEQQENSVSLTKQIEIELVARPVRSVDKNIRGAFKDLWGASTCWTVDSVESELTGSVPGPGAPLVGQVLGQVVEEAFEAGPTPGQSRELHREFVVGCRGVGLVKTRYGHFFCLFCTTGIDLNGGQINDHSLGMIWLVLLLPVTPSSWSRTLAGLFWADTVPFKGP